MDSSSPQDSKHSFILKLCRIGLAQRCPNCDKAPLFKSAWSLEAVDICPSCKFEWKDHDSGDGPAFFIGFFLGLSVIPIALIVALNTEWPMWVHMLIWSPLILGLSVGLLKPSKTIMIALEHIHRSKSTDKGNHDTKNKR